jgi:hypothetical protein
VCRDLNTDTANCGSCGRACAAGQVCSGGSCVVSCGAGLTNCGGTCRDTQTDANHCGACGTACTFANGVGACVAGRCQLAACLTNFSDCDSNPSDGCEVDTPHPLRRDVRRAVPERRDLPERRVHALPLHGGAEGAFAPVTNTTLSPGVHNFTTINIPAGVTVTTNGRRACSTCARRAR